MFISKHLCLYFLCLSIKSPSELQVTLSFMLYMCFSVFNQTPQTHASNLPASVRMSGVCLFVNVCTFVVASVCRLSRVRRCNMHVSQLLSIHSRERVLHPSTQPFWSDNSTAKTQLVLGAWLPWCPSVPPLVRFSRVEQVLLILFDPTG